MDETKIVNMPNVMVAPQEAEEVIVIKNDGKVRVRIQDEEGNKIGVFRFNPTDVAIVNRYNEVADKFSGIVRPLADAGEDVEESDEDHMALLNEAQDKLLELMDYVLNGDSREAFFAMTHAFALTNEDKFYCEVVYEAVGEYIRQKFDARIKRLETRLSKHTHGYRTGKHKKG